MPYETMTTGTTIDPDWANANVRDQVVTPFASAAARLSAITAPVEGMVSYLSDTDTLWMYSGSAWVNITGVWVAYTPAWTSSSGSPTIGNGTLAGRWKYDAWNCVRAEIHLAAGSTTTFGTGVWYFSVPVAKSSTTYAIGRAWLLDNSSGAQNIGVARFFGSNTIEADHSSAGPLSGSVPWTWANGDSLWINHIYEPA